MNGHSQDRRACLKGANRGHAGADLEQKAINQCGEDYERPVDAFLSGSISDSAENGFVRNAMHPESNAAL